MELEYNTRPYIGKITSRPDYEFIKYFLKSAEASFQNLSEASDLGKYTKVAESQLCTAEHLSDILGLGAGVAAGSTVALVAAIDKLIQKRKKCFAISIIDSDSSESFLKTFRTLFIKTGLLAYHSYENQLKNVYLKVGSGDSKKADQRQALHILGGFAGARCFDFMIESGSKENLLKSLTVRSTREKLTSWWRSVTEEKLFYTLCVDDVLEKKYISAYNFFLGTFPVFNIHSSPGEHSPGNSPVNSNSNANSNANANSNGNGNGEAQQQMQYQIRRRDLKRSHSLRVSFKLRRPLDFEMKLENENPSKLKLVPLDVARCSVRSAKGNSFRIVGSSPGPGPGPGPGPRSSKHQTIDTSVQEIFEALEHDESFSWSRKVLVEISGIVTLLREQKKLLEDTNQKVTEAGEGVKENNQILRRGFSNTEAQIESVHLKLNSLMRPLSQVPSPSFKVRFNVKEPIETFTGRKQFIQNLHDSILKSRGDNSIVTVLSQISVITGFGGIGKTETVRMYIHSFGTKYDHVVWIDGEDPSEAENQFFKLARNDLKISVTTLENNPLDFEDVLKQIYWKLCANKHLLLLVFDNAESLNNNNNNNNNDHHPQKIQGIQRFLPQSLPPTLTKPVILVTSRNQNWLQTKNHLGLWSKEDCQEFLLQQLSLQNTPQNQYLTSALGHLFGLCPLALQSAIAVIRQQSKRKELLGNGSYGIQHLISDYKSGKRDVLSKLPSDSSSKTSMMVLWNVSLKKIRDHDHGDLAIQILHVMAYLSPTRIPKELVCALFKEKTENLAEALELLTDYSLVESFENHLSVHRMIQDVTIEHMQTAPHPVKTSDPTETQENELLIDLLGRLKQFLASVSKSSTVFEDILTNIIHITNYVSSPKKLSTEEFFQFTEYIAHEIIKIRINEAEKLFQKLVDYSTSSSPSVSVSVSVGNRRKTERYLHQLGYISLLRGKFKDAFEKYRKLLEEQEVTWGPEDLDTLTTKNSLGLVLYKMGKYDQSMKIYAEVLELREKLLGPSHIHTLQTKHYYAVVMKFRGNVESAMKLYWEVLQVRERELGLTHPDTLTSKNSIANVMKNQGQYTEAKHLYTEVLEAQVNVLGPTDPLSLQAKHNLAMTIDMLGNYQEALQMIEEVLEVQNKVLGPSHPSTLTTKNSKASVLQNQGNYEEALKMFCDVLEAKIDVFGPRHPSTLVTKNNMATVIECQGNVGAAIQMLSEVLEVRTDVLGPGHPRTLKTKNHLHRLRSSPPKLGSEKEAVSFDEIDSTTPDI